MTVSEFKRTGDAYTSFITFRLIRALANAGKLPKIRLTTDLHRELTEEDWNIMVKFPIVEIYADTLHECASINNYQRNICDNIHPPPKFNIVDGGPGEVN